MSWADEFTEAVGIPPAVLGAEWHAMNASLARIATLLDGEEIVGVSRPVGEKPGLIAKVDATYKIAEENKALLLKQNGKGRFSGKEWVAVVTVAITTVGSLILGVIQAVGGRVPMP